VAVGRVDELVRNLVLGRATLALASEHVGHGTSPFLLRRL
jgi:hypothetical protein